jgi:hypothetical protein
MVDVDDRLGERLRTWVVCGCYATASQREVPAPSIGHSSRAMRGGKIMGRSALYLVLNN